jgi:Tol biopolymer transport system component
MTRIRSAALVAVAALFAVALASASSTRAMPNYGLYEIVPGKAPKLLFSRQTVSIVDLSPDRKHMLYSAPNAHQGTSLWISRLNGSHKHVLSARFDGGFARWSPNGRWIAYTRVGSCASRGQCPQVWVVHPAEAGGHPVARDASAPSWSPDSRRLAVIAHPRTTIHGPRAFVGVVPVTGGLVRIISPDRAIVAVSWAPRGDWIAFQTQPQDRRHAPLTRVVVTNGHLVATIKEAAAPAWSPNGRRLAYVKLAPAAPNGPLWVANRDGKGQRQLVSIPVVQPTWSPGSRSIAYLENEEDAQVAMVSVGGGRRRDATAVPEIFSIERFWWSTGGRAIFYTARRVTLPD